MTRRYISPIGLLAISVIGILFMLFSPLVIPPKANCQTTVRQDIPEPSTAWRASIREDICSDGFLTTVRTMTLQLTAPSGIQTQPTDVFSVDAGGTDWPFTVRWTDPQTLLVKILQRNPLIGLSQPRHGDIAIAIEYTN